MKKIIRYFLSIININKIDIYVVSIKKHFIYLKIYFIYLIYPYFIFIFSQKYFNILRNILYIKKLTVNLLITINKSVIIKKKS